MWQIISYFKRYSKQNQRTSNNTLIQIASSFYILKDNFFGSKIAQIESLVDQISFDNNMFVTKFNICQSSLASKMSLLEEFLTIAPK